MQPQMQAEQTNSLPLPAATPHEESPINCSYQSASDEDEIDMPGEDVNLLDDEIDDESAPHWSEYDGFKHVLSKAKQFCSALSKEMRVCAICGERVQANLLTDVDKQLVFKRWLICGPYGTTVSAERKMNETLYPQYPNMNRYRHVCVRVHRVVSL